MCIYLEAPEKILYSLLVMFYDLSLIPITDNFVFLKASEKILYSSLLVMFYDLSLTPITD